MLELKSEELITLTLQNHNQAKIILIFELLISLRNHKHLNI